MIVTILFRSKAHRNTGKRIIGLTDTSDCMTDKCFKNQWQLCYGDDLLTKLMYFSTPHTIRYTKGSVEEP